MSDTEWKRYPRPVYTDPAQIVVASNDAAEAHAEAVEAWYAQPRPPLGVRRPEQVAV